MKKLFTAAPAARQFVCSGSVTVYSKAPLRVFVPQVLSHHPYLNIIFNSMKSNYLLDGFLAMCLFLIIAFIIDAFSEESGSFLAHILLGFIFGIAFGFSHYLNDKGYISIPLFNKKDLDD